MSSEQEMDENFQEEEVAEDTATAEEGGDDSAAADADFTDEDWDAEAGEGGGDDDAGGAADGDGAKKKKKKMNLIIIGVAALVGLGVLYWQMSNKSAKIPPPSAMQAAVPAPTPTDQDIIYGKSLTPESSKTEKSKTAVSGLMNDPNLIKKVQKMSDSHVATVDELMPEPKAPPKMAVTPPKEAAPPMPAPITQASPEKSDQPLTPMPQEAKGTPFTAVVASNNATKTETPKETPKEVPAAPVTPVAKEPAKTFVDPFAATETPKAPETAKTPVTPPPVASIIPTTTPVSPVALAVPVATASNAQLESIASKLDGIESEIKSLRDSSASKDELANLQAQVASLEGRMSGMGSAPTPVHKQTPKKAASAGKPAPKAESAPVHHQKAVASAPKWVLKSAQPGMAIVAKSDGQLVMVKPGDKVPGLGKVKTIAEEKGRWAVRGSAGSVTQ